MAPEYAKDQAEGFVNHIERVAIVGAGGRFGTWLAEALVKAGKHTVTAITRTDSINKLPEGVVAAHVDYSNDETLVDALKGQQVLIITMSVMAPPDTHSKLVEAAAKAGVSYIIPNMWGFDPLDGKLNEDQGFGGKFTQFQNHFTSLGSSAKWIAFACGFWYEFSLGGGPDRYGFDFKERSLVLIDEGNIKINTSTFAQCGSAVAAFLSLKLLPQDENDQEPAISKWENDVVRFASFRVSQLDMFESVKRVTGTKDADWTITHENGGDRFKGAIEDLKKGNFMKGFVTRMYTRVFLSDALGDFETRKGLQNEILGLEEEDIDVATKIAIDRGVNGIL